MFGAGLGLGRGRSGFQTLGRLFDRRLRRGGMFELFIAQIDHRAGLRLWMKSLATKELELGLADADDVALVQLLFGYPLAVDKGAIGRGGILNDDVVALNLDFTVNSGDFGIAKPVEDFQGLTAAQLD